MTTEEIKGRRKRWTREETLLLLQCYNARKAEFKRSRKKTFAYANVLVDMLSRGFLDTTITTRTLEAKMRTLLIAYKNAKNNNRQTGSPYMVEMDEIFGSELITCNSNTLNLCTTIQRLISESSATPAVGPSSLSDSLWSSAGEDTTSTSNDASPAVSPSRNSRKKSAKEKYYEKKLELKKQFYEDIKRMISDKLNAPKATKNLHKKVNKRTTNK